MTCFDIFIMFCISQIIPSLISFVSAQTSIDRLHQVWKYGLHMYWTNPLNDYWF